MSWLTDRCSQEGPTLTFFVGVSDPRRKVLEEAGEPVPPVVPVLGLIDTGADGTCIDPTVLRPLNLDVRSYTPMITPSTGSVPVQVAQYDVNIILKLGNNVHDVRAFSTVPIVEADLATQGIQALIGRDILSRCLFIYDGREAKFTLAF